MRELVFFPTPNWFISRPIDIDLTNGSLAITAFSSIIITNNFFSEFNFTLADAHTKRLHAVAFAPPGTDLLLASCSEDFDVKIWNLNSRTLHYHHKLHQSSVTCIGWLKDPNEPQENCRTIVSGDLKGNIFKYNLSTSVHNRYYPDSNKPITQMSIHPHQPWAAVGYKHGTIMILDLSAPQLNVLHKLKNHEDAVNCLIWTSSDVLVSSAEDRCVRVWQMTANEGSELNCFRVPGTSGSGSSANRTQQTINYTPLCAPRPNLLLTASFKGELFYLDLDVEGSKWTAFTALTGDNQNHKKAIFQILSFKNRIITLALDRLINLWDLETYKQESSISTVNGFIYSISNSPIDPNLFAVSVGDSSIKFFNEKQDLKCTKNFNNNIKTEVTQVCWHPQKENIIAFGTKDGKVGLADIFANNKPAQYIFTNYNQSVYTLAWSEPLLPLAQTETATAKSKSGSKKIFFLYTVADAKIIQHHVHLGAGGGQSICGQNTPSTNFYKELLKHLGEVDANGQSTEQDLNKSNKSSALEFGLTEIAIFDKYFAIGKYDGSIEIYRKDPVLVVRLASLFNHQKLITCIRCSPDLKLMASGSNDFNVIVIDLEQLAEEASKKSNQKLFAQFKSKLVGHKERITSLSWSQFDPQLLVSCSYDLTVQVWNAYSGLPIANYRGHSEKLLCCAFSSIDSNVVFSGGEDYCLLRWRIDAQTNTTPPNECLSNGKKRGKFGRKHDKKKSKPSADSISLEKSKTLESKSSESEIDLDERDEISQVSKLVQPMSIMSEPSKHLESSSQQDTLKIITEIEAIHIDSEPKVSAMPAAPSRKPVKSGSPGHRELKTLFVLSSSFGGAKSNVKKLSDCLKLFETLYEKKPEFQRSTNWNEDIGLTVLDFGDPEQATITRLFGNRPSIFHMLRQETAELRAMNYEKWWLLNMWKGDIKDTIDELRRTNTFTDLAVIVYETALNSPTRNPDVMNAYIEQLRASAKEHSENIHKAVLLSLSLFNVEKAVRIYLENDMYQYALCLAIIRKAPQFHELVVEVLEKYAAYATSVGDYETAVMCHLRLHDVENAFSSLLRRNTKGDEACEMIFEELSRKFKDFLSHKAEEVSEEMCK